MLVEIFFRDIAKNIDEKQREKLMENGINVLTEEDFINRNLNLK